MCEQTEINYLDGDVVWVKLGSCWWPGEVVAPDKLPPDVLPSFKKPPIAVVKFFQEDTYEYVKNINSIYKYNCSRKNEFINKGLYMYRTKHGHMEKFPEDVIRAETAVGGDIEILTRDEFQETKKESYAGIFGDPKKTPANKKGKGRGRPPAESPQTIRPIRKMKEKTDYKVHILVQGSKTPSTTNNESSDTSEITPAPSTSATEPSFVDKSPEVPQNDNKPISSVSTPSTPSTPSGVGPYACHACSFSTSRLNVLILHNKTHSVSFVPYTPSPVRKKPVTKPQPKSTPTSSKTPKPRKPRAEKPDKPKKQHTKKRLLEEKAVVVEVKKPKTDEEIKSSLLADWDDGDEDSNDESSNMASSRSPEVAVGAESPAVPTPAELPTAHIPDELSSVAKKKSDSSLSSEKPESSSDSKYEFCEDEDWPVEADAGRKIPRVKNPKRTDDTKSLSLDEDEVAREVAELLNKTSVPELPSVPEPLKVEENFPEPSVVKSPDKKRDKSPDKVTEKPPEQQTTKAIFKTKTFFRSRHSRSQDAIGKYVAEQLNAVERERMDIADCDINGSDAVSSPEARDSPPIEPVKITRLAPKIQLKKMKAEAAQLREKEKNNYDISAELYDMGYVPDVAVSDSSSIPESQLVDDSKHKENENALPKLLDNLTNPTQETEKLIEAEVVETATVNNAFTEKEISTVGLVHKVNNEVNPGKGTQNEIEKVPEIDFSEPPQKETAYVKATEHTPSHYLNESTASAVDALLSVSRDTDRVTKNISNDPPEDLFEDDNAPGEQEELILHTNGQSNENAEFTNEFIDNGTSLLKTQDNIETVSSENIESEEVVLDESQTSNDIVMKDVSLNLNNSQPALEDKDIPTDNVPSESDLQIAETLINLPATAIHSKSNELTQNLAPMAFEAEERSQEEEVTLNSQDEIVPSNSQEEIIPFNSQEETVSLSNQEEIIPFSSQEETVTLSECVEETVIEEKEQLNETENNFEEAQTHFATKNDVICDRFESELEKNENLNAAQSLVQMSESIEHKVSVMDTVNNEEPIDSDAFNVKTNNGINVKTNNGIDSKTNSVEQTLANVLSEKIIEPEIKTNIFDTPSKLLKILEEPPKPRNIPSKLNPSKQIIVQGKEKILNFDVAKSTFKSKSQTPKQKIIIRRTAPSKSVINNMNEKMPQEKIILSRSGNLSQESPSVKTYTIQTSPDPPSDANTIIIQQKIRKITTPKPPPKLQKVKQQTSLVAPVTEVMKPVTETITTDEAMFDINSMPIVLSDDLLTPESIEKMPVVMPDANIITHTQNTPKLIKPKPPTIVETEKISVTSSAPKPELKRLLLNPVADGTKTSSPNILSKSTKRGAKPLLIIDRTTGKQKIVMGKQESIPKEIKQPPTIIQAPQITKQTPIIKQTPQAPKTEKFIILPTQNQPRPTRTQKIVIDPQTGKAHVIVAKSNEMPMTTAENKPVSAKLVPSNSDASAPGNTVMIITNAQGTQSRIVLTPEHEKILFPNKQQPNVSQLKTITHRITTNSPTPKKIITTMGSVRATAAPAKPPTRIVPKQKSAIITSKGQLIVGGRVATTSQNIAPMPEIRAVPKARPAPEPKKIVQTVQKTNSEPIIFLQQKSGAVMQLTAAQFEHLQRTGQIVQKTTVPTQEKVIIQKAKPVSEASGTPKPRVRKATSEAPTPSKKMKQQEVAIAPAPAPAPSPLPVPALVPALPALSPVSVTPAPVEPPPVPSVSNTVSISSDSAYTEFENFEELLPSTAIARQLPEPPQPAPQLVPQLVPQLAPQPAPQPPPVEPAAPLSDGQLLAVPGEHFGGPVGTFYLCVEDNGTFTPIDNRPLVLENNQLVPMGVEAVPAPPAQPERRDILEAALANSDVFHADGRDEAPDFRDLNANVSVHCRVSETSTTLNQPIMTPVEVPSAADTPAAVPAGLDAGLAVLGVTPASVPTSLELPITVTDPRIAPRVSDPLAGAAAGYSLVSVAVEPAVSASAVDTVISMPLLTEEESVENGRSMPILTEEGAASSVESVGSPASPEDAAQWPHPRRLLTPASDTSDTSAEIPLQPQLQLQLAVDDLSTHT